MPRLAVIVLSYDGQDVLPACLESLRGELTDADSAIVIDNASADGSADLVAAAHPWARLVRLPENRGYAGGMNAGLRIALDEAYEFALVLNQDTVVPAGTIEALIDGTLRYPFADSFQPLLVRLGADQTIDSAGQRLHRVPGASDWLAGEPVSAAPPSDVEVFGPCGAAALHRTAALRASGLFDEDHFLIFEDVDLAFRMRGRGSRAVLLAGARILHRRGISGEEAQPSPLRRFLVARNGVAVALRQWPLRWLLATAPVVAVRALRALLGSSGRARVSPSCLALWRRAVAERGAARAAARRHGTDVWLTTRCRRLPTGVGETAAGP